MQLPGVIQLLSGGDPCVRHVLATLMVSLEYEYADLAVSC